MPVTAGSPIVAEDFMEQLDEATADIVDLESAVSAVVTAFNESLEITKRGSVVGTPSVDGDLVVTFPEAFASNPIVVAFPGDISAVFMVQMVGASLSTTGVTVRCFDPAGAAVTGVAVRVNWIACGTPA